VVCEILSVARMCSVLDVEIPFRAMMIGFLCMFTINLRWMSYCKTWIRYQGADKSLAWPGRKQARKHVRDVRDFSNIKMQTVIRFFFFPLQGKVPKEIQAILAETLSYFLPGRAKDLSAPLYFRYCCTFPFKMIMHGFYRKSSASAPFSNVIWNKLLWYH